MALPTNYSFGQSSRLLGAPAQWLRTLGQAGQHELVAKNLNTAISLRGDKLEGEKGDVKVLLVSDDEGENTTLQAVTSKTYGRIWDADVVKMTKRLVEAHPEFHNPLEWSGRRGGLYASDRDVFMFFIDGGSIVDGGADLLSGGDRDQLHRGFFVWNSEVGAATMGIAAFLFRMVCGNHMIHGIEGVRLLKIRHTSGGPERFLTEVMPALEEYTNASAKPLEAAVKAAKQFALPSEDAKLADFFVKKGFTKAEVKRAKQYAEVEEGGAGHPVADAAGLHAEREGPRLRRCPDRPRTARWKALRAGQRGCPAGQAGHRRAGQLGGTAGATGAGGGHPRLFPVGLTFPPSYGIIAAP